MAILDFIPPLLQGARVTAELAAASSMLGGLLAFVFGIARLSEQWAVRVLAIVYVEVFRGTSLLVQLFWIFFALPLLGLHLPAWTAGVLALTLNIGAYGAEVVRGAIQAVSKEQYEAAAALNFTKRHTLWRILLPQAIVEMMPPLGNLAVQNLKSTALVSLITLNDLTFQAQNLRNLTQQSLEVYTLTLFMYFALALAIAGIHRWLELRVSRWVHLGGGR
ncbi:ectoine/hydroxyectoine ABC transporter permease subunit EhuC [Thermus oshimai]